MCKKYLRNKISNLIYTEKVVYIFDTEIQCSNIYISLQVRLQTALNQPQVATRCEEVARILSEATTKDAGYILKATVESLLGLTAPSTLQGNLGWGLRVITRSAQPREFEQLRAFLGPNGPLLALIFRLASDPYMAFEFPVAWLPV